jgi:uncharacterized glyoxalase superfamily protein PhnB
MYDPKRGYPVVVPCVLYDDIPRAVRWLSATLGFREIVRASLPDGWTGHAEVERDGFILLLGRRGGALADTSSITQVYVADLATSCENVGEAGGTVLEPPTERPWGVRQAVVADPEGQRWVFTEHVSDTDPSDWVGQLFESQLG